LTWILDVSDEEYPPSSNSISWGANERFVAASTFETFNNEAMKLGVQGVTIIVSSGDNGAAGASGDCDKVSGSSQFKWKVCM
jgi:subtilase family serine protease